MANEKPKRDLVIFAEDENISRTLFELFMREAGYDYKLCENGQIALDLIKSLSESDRARAILVTDNQMPEMNGVNPNGSGIIESLAEAGIQIPTMLQSSSIDSSMKSYLEDLQAEGSLSHFREKRVGTTKEDWINLINTTIQNFDAKMAAKQEKPADTVDGNTVTISTHSKNDSPPLP
jgi:CheY-like chemotaxis protein